MDNILRDAQNAITAQLSSSSCLSAIPVLTENLNSLEYEVKKALGKQGLVMVVMTPRAKFLGNYTFEDKFTEFKNEIIIPEGDVISSITVNKFTFVKDSETWYVNFDYVDRDGELHQDQEFGEYGSEYAQSILFRFRLGVPGSQATMTSSRNKLRQIAWECDGEVDVIENPTVNRGNPLSGDVMTGQDAAMATFEVLGNPNDGSSGKFSIAEFEEGANGSLVVCKAKFKFALYSDNN